jgi:hypothetical protein
MYEESMAFITDDKTRPVFTAILLSFYPGVQITSDFDSKFFVDRYASM